jgi:EAL and modified HD-GYP domain-containing signal transduction protein
MTDSIYVARQPLLTPASEVFGYELLYRASWHAESCVDQKDVAAARVLTDSLFSIGLDGISGGLPVFLNVTRSLLLQDLSTLLQPESAILEILEDVVIDDQVIEACRSLHEQGYTLALDDFVEGSPAEALLPYARFVKIDVLQYSAAQLRALAGRLSARGLRVVAEKVETQEMFEETRQQGYSLFQGYYFCRPRTLTARAVPARQLAYLHLISALRDPNLSLIELENLVKHDVSITYRVLRLVNSAAFATRREVTVLRDALRMVGIKTIAAWVSVWAMTGLNRAPGEVATLAMMRARTCELLGDVLDGEGDRLFLLGLCSMLDTMLGVPLETALEALPLAAEIQNALHGLPGKERSMLDAVIAYERGEWTEAERIAGRLGVPAASLPEAYRDALRWTATLTREPERKAV